MDGVQHRLLRLRPPAHGAAVRQRLEARQGHEPQLEGGLYQLGRLVQDTEGVQGVQQQPQQLRRVLRLCRGIRQIGQIGGKAQSHEVRPQAGEQLQRLRLVQHEPLTLFVDGQFRIGQQLTRRRQTAVFPPGAPCNEGDLPPIRGQHRQNFVRLPGHGFPQHQSGGDDGLVWHDSSSHRCSRYSSGAPVSRKRFQ